MATSQIVLQGKDTAEQGELYIAFELGDKQWKLSCSDGRRGPSRYSVSAGDKHAVLDCFGRAKARCGLGPTAKGFVLGVAPAFSANLPQRVHWISPPGRRTGAQLGGPRWVRPAMQAAILRGPKPGRRCDRSPGAVAARRRRPTP